MQENSPYRNAALSKFIKEAHVIREIRYVLDLLQNRGDLKYVRINVAGIIRGGGPYPRVSKNPDMAGMPDILIWIRSGPVLCVEVKRPIGYRLSAAQKRFREEISAIGHVYEVVSNLTELQGILHRYGITI